MGWPKGKPRKGPETPPAPAPPPAMEQPKRDGGAFQPTAGPKREGGKSALMAENQEMALKSEEEPTTQRDKIADDYTKQMYGTPEEEHSPEQLGAPPASEEEQPESSEEAAPEEEPGEQQPEEETVPVTRYKEAEDKMHQATTEAANWRKFLEEITPAIDMDKLRNLRGETKPKEEQKAPMEPPSQDLFVTDYPKWYEQSMNSVADRVVEKIKTEFMPQATNEITSKTEWKRLEDDFKKQYKDAFEDISEGMDLMNVYINRARKTNPSAPPSELVELARPTFEKRLAQIFKKPTKKVIPLESPGKAKERGITAPEREMTMQDWEKEGRDYISFRQKRLGELQSR